MFSRSSGYAIHALTYLAEQPPGRLTGAREIAAAAQIPRPFLWKILRNLSQKKLLRSFKGVRGGYEMARAPGKITIAQILEATRSDDPLQSCILRAGAVRRPESVSAARPVEEHEEADRAL